MALTAILTQTSTALLDSPTNFVLAVTNPSGAPINVTMISPWVRTPSGAGASAMTAGPYSPPGLSVPQVGGAQFNVQIAAGATTNFAFQAIMYGATTVGPPQSAMATPVYTVGCDCLGSDSATFAPSPLVIAPSRPIYGRPGSPTNSIPLSPGAFDFSTPSNSGLLQLLGL